MRLQHNISPPLPGRGNQKRKQARLEQRLKDEANGLGHLYLPSGSRDSDPFPEPTFAGPNEEEYARIVHTAAGLDDPSLVSLRSGPSELGPDGTLPTVPTGNTPPPMSLIEDEEEEEFLPPSLMPHFDPNTGLVMGRSVPMTKYLVTKAKHQYVLAEHELLLDELELMRKEEERVRTSKDGVLDRVFVAELG